MRAVILVVPLLLAAQALAAPPESEEAKREATRHFKVGAVHYTNGKYDEARQEYEKAYALMPAPNLLFNLGQASRMLGDKPKAVDYYKRFVEAKPTGQASDEAREHIAALEKKIAEEKPIPAVVTPAPVPVVAAPVVQPPPAEKRPEEQATPVYKKWWLWTAIAAVVVVGAGVGVGVALGTSGSNPPASTGGNFPVF